MLGLVYKILIPNLKEKEKKEINSNFPKELSCHLAFWEHM